MRNSTLLFNNFAYKRLQLRKALEQLYFLAEGVSFIFNQICKKCTKSIKNLSFKVHFSAAKRTKKCKCKN